MKLIQAKIRGLGATMETQWFDLSPQLNLFHFPNKESGENFLRALQTINPPYSFQNTKPFADFPATIKQGEHTRHVIAAKRTVALTVFSATSRLVQELARISPLLYEADRIEVGRRLDYSRWINFVELASSSRWSEIETDIRDLLRQSRLFAPKQNIALSNIITNLKPSDRIKNELQHQLADLLQEISSKLGKDAQQHIETIMAKIYRAKYFQKARSLVGRRLPIFALLPSEVDKQKTVNNNSTCRSDLLHFRTIRSRYIKNKSASSKQHFLDEINKQFAQLSFPGKALQLKKTERGMSIGFNDTPEQIADSGQFYPLRHIQADAYLAIALSRVVCGTSPILLFAEPEQFLPETLHGELADFVRNLSKSCQCLYGSSHTSIFPKGVPRREYNATELSTRRK